MQVLFSGRKVKVRNWQIVEKKEIVMAKLLENNDNFVAK